jgi:hypothetical protein
MKLWIQFAYELLAPAGGMALGWFICQRWSRPRWEHDAIRNWYPSADVAEAMFPRDEELERLAQRRELHDSGRLYPARNDAGRPARLYRAKARGKRSTL